MHSTDALYLKTPCHFPLGIKQFLLGKTQRSLWTQLSLDRTRFSCVGCFHLWHIQNNMGRLSRLITLDWMVSSICLTLSKLHFLLNLMRRTWMTGFLYCTQTCGLHLKKKKWIALFLGIITHRWTIKTKKCILLFKKCAFSNIILYNTRSGHLLEYNWHDPSGRTWLTTCLSKNAMYRKKA